jgi:hypothetical protein
LCYKLKLALDTNERHCDSKEETFAQRRLFFV